MPFSVKGGTVVVKTQRMKKSRSTSTPAPLLRWIFRRGDRALTCQLEREPGHAYAVSLVAYWDVTCAAIETFDAGVAAFQRHAALALDLRRGGWTLVACGVAA